SENYEWKTSGIKKNLSSFKLILLKMFYKFFPTKLFYQKNKIKSTIVALT
ncbi:hypothetical protein OMAG_002575, partial [Candidatus Omnitrophus magneticus]